MADRELELRELAKEMVWLQDELKKERLSEWEREEVKEGLEQLRQKILKGGFSPSLLVQYMEEYRNMSVVEYMEVYKKN